MKVKGTPIDNDQYKLTITGGPEWARRLILWVAIHFGNKKLVHRGGWKSQEGQNYALFEEKPR